MTTTDPAPATPQPLPVPTPQQLAAAQQILMSRLNSSAAAALADHRKRTQPLLDVYRAAAAFLQGRTDQAALQIAVDTAHQRMAELAIGGEG